MVCGKTPLIRINWNSGTSGYAENPDNLIFFLKIGYIDSLKFGCYYLQYAPLPKHFDHAWFEVLQAITLYCTWSGNREFKAKLILYSWQIYPKNQGDPDNWRSG